MANPVTIGTHPAYLPIDGVYSAWDFRASEVEQTPGVVTPKSFKVIPYQGAPGPIVVDIGKNDAGLMMAYVPGSTRSGQGVYRVDNIDRTAPTTDTFIPQLTVDMPNADPSNPRIDIVVLRVVDSMHGSDADDAIVEVIEGIATSGATLANRNGAPAVPANALLLADVLRPAGSGPIQAGWINDRRPMSAVGVAPTSGVVIPRFVLPTGDITVSGNGAKRFDVQAVHIPRRCAATAIRWQYKQGATALTGSYAFAIYAAGGALVASTAKTTITGSANNTISHTTNLASPTVIPPGNYFLLFATDLTNSGTITTHGTLGAFAPAAGFALVETSAGSWTSAPSSVSSLGDIDSGTGSTAKVPYISIVEPA